MKKIHFNTYKKLKNIDISLSLGINAIAGGNGTCKTSILHVLGNSYQQVKSTDSRLENSDCLKVINAINYSVNPKIESLTRGDKAKNDPAPGEKGAFYTATYNDGTSLSFRKHDSRAGLKAKSRYSIKPTYKSGAKESLPAAPVIYLGLSRLVPFGEFLDDDKISNQKVSLPQKHLSAIADNFRKMTNIETVSLKPQNMGSIKKRADFTTSTEGVDSNTISAGQDNLLIILTALESLAYYHESLKSDEVSESLLLIDEIEATLHPAFQIELARIFEEYFDKYGIQVVFTTHSLTLLEYLIKSRQSVIYLMDNIVDVLQMESPDMLKINMHLKQISHKDIYIDKIVPIFSEDEEARFVFRILADQLARNSTGMRQALSTFHLVKCSMGSDNLRLLFGDDAMRQSTISAICLLDGDQTEDPSKNIVALPGKNSPEKFIFDYGIDLVNRDVSFWREDTVINSGYSKPYFLSKIKEPYSSLLKEAENKAAEGLEKDGYVRKQLKSLFNDNKELMKLILIRWANDDENRAELTHFYHSLHSMFLKVSKWHGIPNELWPKTEQISWT